MMIPASRRNPDQFAPVPVCRRRAVLDTLSQRGHLMLNRSLIALFVLLASFAFPQNRPDNDDTTKLLQSLADAPGPPGFEEPVRKIMVERMKPLSGKITYDGLGSV